MFSASATMPTWEQSIRAHTALSVLSLRTGSMHSLVAFEAAQLTASIYSEDAPLPDDVKSQLTSINAVSVQNVQTTTGTYTNTVQGLKNTQPNQDAWQATILSANQAAIQNFTDRINNAGNEAIQTIQNLPAGQQNAAANVYSGGMNIVNNVVNQASNAVMSVVNSIKDFLQGIWNKVTEVYNDVKTWCSGALDTLGSLFGFAFFSAFTLAKRGDAVAARTAHSFTGFVGWNAAVGMGPARTSFDEILKRLDDDAHISIASETLSTMNPAGVGASIVGRVELGAKFAAGQGSAADLSEVWERAMNGHDKPLSTTPLPVSQQEWQNVLGGSDETPPARRATTPIPGGKGLSFPRKFGRPPLTSNGNLEESPVAA
ncbi:hypothetical protein K4K60_005896 [Colletotrichum sp. SAR11_57]|nr:hypothetical protein K4K60_005896 [Colletotrichum sp. SAR11_57]